jgi:hypothetical protein
VGAFKASHVTEHEAVRACDQELQAHAGEAGSQRTEAPTAP